MAISVLCRSCDRQFKVKDDLAGSKVRCPDCQKVVAVPDTPQDELDVDDEGRDEEEARPRRKALDFDRDDKPRERPEPPRKRKKEPRIEKKRRTATPEETRKLTVRIIGLSMGTVLLGIGIPLFIASLRETSSISPIPGIAMTIFGLLFMAAGIGLIDLDLPDW